MFRLLKAEEIECRVSTVKEKGCSLLLYKDARCDMNILDETVGAYNWKREHGRDNANCTVSIWDKDKMQWIGKEDTGTESYTEKEKGLASDSFKRACFNWGIGRELYTAPFIWIELSEKEIVKKGENYTTYAKFFVKSITYENKIIKSVVIVDSKGVVRFGKTEAVSKKEALEKEYKKASEKQLREINHMISLVAPDMKKVNAYYKINSFDDCNEELAERIIKDLAKKYEEQEISTGGKFE
jgi:hypothetical protein